MDAAAALDLIDEWDADNMSIDGLSSESDIDVLSSSEEELLDEALLGLDAGNSSNSTGSGADGSSDNEIDGLGRGAGRGVVCGLGVLGRGGRGGRGRGRGVLEVGGGRGRGRGRGVLGRGAGRGRGGQHFLLASSYDDVDDGGFADTPEFQPTDDEFGLQLPQEFQPTCEGDFFMLFFIVEVVDSIVRFKNERAAAHIATSDLT